MIIELAAIAWYNLEKVDESLLSTYWLVHKLDYNQLAFAYYVWFAPYYDHKAAKCCLCRVKDVIVCSLPVLLF